MKHSNKILPLFCLMTIASCGGGSGGGTKGSQIREEIAVSDGNYKAILRPYNFTLSGWVPNGVTDISVNGDEIIVKSWLDDSANVTHMQNIHVGSVCPGMEDDANRDGFVDFKEGQAVSGGVLLPLDENLTTINDSSVFPKGNFTYFQKSSVSEISQSLGKDLALEGKVIIVMGTSNKTLPETISVVNGQSKEISVPIACGIIEKRPEVASN